MRSRGCGDCEERPSRGEPAPALDKSATKPHRSCLRSSALAEYLACENCTWIWAWFRLLGVCAQVGYARRVGAAVQGCLSSRTSAEARGDPLVLGARSTVSGVRRAVFFFFWFEPWHEPAQFEWSEDGCLTSTHVSWASGPSYRRMCQRTELQDRKSVV